MKNRILGRTGLVVGEIGMGCEGLAVDDGANLKSFIDYAEKAGVNYLDMYIANPKVGKLLGDALKGRREKFILQAHLCSAWKDEQYKRTRDIADVRAAYETLFANLQTDYVDIGMIHYVDADADWSEVESGAVMQYAKELKAAGKIKHIGMSSHNPTVALKAVNSGLIDVLMFSVNPCYDLQPASEDIEELWAVKSYENQLLNMDKDREALYETCQRLGVAITVMKAFGGGDLLSEEFSPAGKALTVNQCLHYALTRPAVATVLSGARTVAELEACVAYENASDEEKDYAASFAAFPKISWAGHCMYCGHCAPCPVGIDVAMVTKFLNLTKAQGEIPETVREHYAVLPHKAGECVQCGACETRCPFGVSIMENMVEAKRVFGM